MTRMLAGKVMPLVALLILALVLGSCGREAPVYQPGSIYVTSTPEGAAIFLDGQATGEVTPFTLTGLVPDNYLISVELDGYMVAPLAQTAIVTPLVTSQLTDFTLSQTSLTVTSTPEGASIFLDGNDTGEVTPATLVGVSEGSVEVSLALENYLVAPASFTANVIAGQVNEIPDDTFVVRARHTVLFEGFSNVSCQGCPQMASNMEAVQHMPEYGLDRVLYLKYSMQWPSASDPHYVHNTTENDARMNYYLNDVISGIPVMNMSGSKVTGTSANSTPNPDEIVAYLEGGALAMDPGFLIDVEADFANTTIPVTVTLTATSDVDLTGKTLFVALVQTFVEYEEAPGSEGETEFHNLFRDQADSVDALTNLTAGDTQVVATSLVRGDWDLDTMLAIAFVQDDSDHTIYQAGSTALSATAKAAQFTDAIFNHRIITSGGE